jgi:hypothetical protein
MNTNEKAVVLLTASNGDRHPLQYAARVLGLEQIKLKYSRSVKWRDDLRQFTSKTDDAEVVPPLLKMATAFMKTL